MAAARWNYGSDLALTPDRIVQTGGQIVRTPRDMGTVGICLWRLVQRLGGLGTCLALCETCGTVWKVPDLKCGLLTRQLSNMYPAYIRVQCEKVKCIHAGETIRPGGV